LLRRGRGGWGRTRRPPDRRAPRSKLESQPEIRLERVRMRSRDGHLSGAERGPSPAPVQPEPHARFASHVGPVQESAPCPSRGQAGDRPSFRPDRRQVSLQTMPARRRVGLRRTARAVHDSGMRWSAAGAIQTRHAARSMSHRRAVGRENRCRRIHEREQNGPAELREP
jgi:hypothetical protein